MQVFFNTLFKTNIGQILKLFVEFGGNSAPVSEKYNQCFGQRFHCLKPGFTFFTSMVVGDGEKNKNQMLKSNSKTFTSFKSQRTGLQQSKGARICCSESSSAWCHFTGRAPK
jgi:hypothetical protein